MIFAAYFILAFWFLQTVVAFANLLFREKLKGRNVDVAAIKLSVLIPARDEEENIAHILSDLVERKENIFEILVYNDHSTDKTAEIIADFARQDNRVKLVQPQPLPDKWLGKNFACHQLGLHATGDYFLFVDADVRIKKPIITKVLQYVDYHNVGLLSIFPKQEMRSFAEKITVPNMHYILLSLLVLPLVRFAASFPTLSAANGQFMLLKSDVYRRCSPHATFKNSRAEDIEIARHLKKKRRKNKLSYRNTRNNVPDVSLAQRSRCRVFEKRCLFFRKFTSCFRSFLVDNNPWIYSRLVGVWHKRRDCGNRRATCYKAFDFYTLPAKRG